MSYIILGLISSIFAALMALFAKIGLDKVDSLTATFLRSVVMVGFFAIIFIFSKKWNQVSTFDNKAWFWLTASAIAGALSWIAFFYALKSGPVTKVSVLDRTSIAFVLILAALFLGEQITWKTLVGVLLIIGGAFLTILK